MTGTALDTRSRDTRLPPWLLDAMHTALRVMTGALFMQHGVQKLFGLLVDPARPWSGPPAMFSQFWIAGCWRPSAAPSSCSAS